MANTIQSIRGMNDILPDDARMWHRVETAIIHVLNQYGYQEIRLPIMELTEVFSRSIGEVTDIVEKEMYTFTDRNGSSLSLRPEGTAGCVRAAIQNGLLHNQTQRLWYQGPMFRHERPQQGRYRQFFQFGVESFGFVGPDVDAELILLSARLWQNLRIADKLELQLNSLGSLQARQAYKSILVEYLQANREQLDEDSKRRLQLNPLRILDSKNPEMEQLIAGAPSLREHLDQESLEHFERLQELLSQHDVDFTINPRLVRGLDYYNKTVFEWVSSDLGAQGTVCAGGRYDGLVEQLGGRPTPAAGFALGLERLVSLVQQRQQVESQVDFYVVHTGENSTAVAMQLAEQLRNEFPSLQTVCHCGEGSFKSQFKKANKHNANYAIVIGDDEFANQTVTVKPMQDDSQQINIGQHNFINELKNFIGSDRS